MCRDDFGDVAARSPVKKGKGAVEAHARSPRDLFEGKEHYEIPPFQRPYVWTEEDQWAPLWDDVVRVAESFIVAKERGTDPQVPHHFLGAVVYESKPPIAGDVARHDVIDGQQRMTTLQVLIDASRQVYAERGFEIMAEDLQELTHNQQTAFRGKRERFKLWPSQVDRPAFTAVMDGTNRSDAHQIGAAHRFFIGEVRRWISGAADEDDALPPATEALRVEALASTLKDRLLLVAIDLTGHDDSQLIFETLNDRGTPLLKADLIKNWVFRRAEQIGADTERWAADYWADFDGAWWREEITQGRLSRSRIDIFLQYWLTMRRTEEVKAEQVFRVFVEHATPQMADEPASEDLLRELRNDADTYKNLAQLDMTTPAGRYHRLVIETLELAATTPVFLWLLSDNHRVPEAQRALGLAALESWVVRRTLLRLTTKDVNKFMVTVLKMLAGVGPCEAGDRLREYLSRQTAETRAWPPDEDLLKLLPDQRIYGSLTQKRIRALFSEVESKLRSDSAFHEAVTMPAGLEVEHVMPQGWRTHWNTHPPLEPQAAAERDRLVNTLGNLTLTTKGLNISLSNRPWTDQAAGGLKEGGSAGLGKHSLLAEFSLLVLNKQILTHETEWNEADIKTRGRYLTGLVCEMWPAPDMEIRSRALETVGQAAGAALTDVPWTAEDMGRLACESGEAMTALLDHLALHVGESWSSAQIAAAGVTDRAGSALGALTLKARGPFGRANPPVAYEKLGGVWHYSLTREVAAHWRAARALPDLPGQEPHTGT